MRKEHKLYLAATILVAGMAFVQMFVTSMCGAGNLLHSLNPNVAHDVAMRMDAMGKRKEALAFLQASIKSDTKEYHECLRLLGLWHAEAEEYGLAKDVCRRISASNDPATAAREEALNLHGFAFVMREHHRYRQAANLLKLAVAVEETIPGEDLLVARDKYLLAHYYKFVLDKPEMATALCKQALPVFAKKLGPADKWTVGCNQMLNELKMQPKYKRLPVPLLLSNDQSGQGS